MQIRREGVTSGTSDTYFFSPSGKRFRSCAEIARHFRLDPSAPRKRPSLGSSKGAKASGRPPPLLLPPPPARFASPPSTSTDGEAGTNGSSGAENGPAASDTGDASDGDGVTRTETGATFTPRDSSNGHGADQAGWGEAPLHDEP